MERGRVVLTIDVEARVCLGIGTSMFLSLDQIIIMAAAHKSMS